MSFATSFLRFVLVGLLSGMFYFFLLWFLGYIFSGVSIFVFLFSYIGAVCLHFTFNKIFTFENSDGLVLVGSKYFVLVVLNACLFSLFVFYANSFFSISPELGSLFGIGITTVSGFFISRYWVYRR